MNGDADDEGDSHSAPEHVNGNAGYPSDRHSEAEHNGQANGHDNHGYGPNAQLSSDEEHSNGQHVGLNVNYHGGDFESLSEDTDSQANQGPAPSSSDEDGEVYEHTNGQANQGPDADSDYDADGEANGHENGENNGPSKGY